jgi:glutathionylspermidine synthase
MRFDFHWTREGWRISEVNSDVPGGFTESSAFPELMVRHYGGCEVVGDVAGEWTSALVERAEGRPIALLSAAGFMEDHQITNFLARRIEGHAPFVITGKQLRWRGGRAMVGEVEIGLLLRFFQAEWLPSLGRNSGWENFFESKTPISNPACSILSESKRFGLVWDELRTELPTWRRLLPQSRDPREMNWRRDEGWLLKSALCNNGDSVSIPGTPQWSKARRSARWFPSQWVAQRRFETLPIETPAGAMYPCLGVYVLDGKAIGIYGRISAKAVIDHTAIDVAVLLEKE